MLDRTAAIAAGIPDDYQMIIGECNRRRNWPIFTTHHGEELDCSASYEHYELVDLQYSCTQYQ